MVGRPIRSLVKAVPRPFRKAVRTLLGPTLSSGVARWFGILKAPNVKRLEDKLWGGFSSRALADLDQLTRGAHSSKEAAEAARDMAGWFASHGDYEQAVQYAELARNAYYGSCFDVRQVMLEVDALLMLGRDSDAQRLIEAALSQLPDSANVLELLLANTYAAPSPNASADPSDAARLALINRSYERVGLASLSKIDPNGPLNLNNITAQVPARSSANEPKVSILIPAFNAATTLEMTLQSLQRQTWKNLEILIVDDDSPDRTFEIAERAAANDPRIFAFRQPRNLGAYVARNTALHAATGEYITVHDADDWSHPQKIEVQVRHLIDNPGIPANLTDWVRCLPHLYFRPRARAILSWIHYNHSSLMLQRKLLVALGGWDEVRIAADSELIRRIEHGLLDCSVPRIHLGVPLSFALVEKTSLTQQSVTHAKTIRHGVRRTYLETSTHWLKSQGRGVISLTRESPTKPFPVPSFILGDRPPSPSVDLLFILDTTRQGEPYDRTLRDMHAANKGGKRVAFLQWLRYRSNVTTRLPEEILSAAQDDALYIASPGEQITSKSVVCYDPFVFRDLLDLVPRVTTERVELASLVDRRETTADEKHLIEANVLQVFGVAPNWF